VVELARVQDFLLGEGGRDVGQVGLMVVLQVGEDIHLVKPHAVVVVGDFKLEVVGQQIVGVVSADLLIKASALLSHHKDAPKEYHEQLVHNRVLLQCFLHSQLALAHFLQEVSQYLFNPVAAHAHIVGSAVLGHCHLKILIVEDVIDLLQVFLVVAVLALEDQLQQLEAEYYLMRVWVVLEYFDLSIIVHQVVIKERWVTYGGDEQLGLGAGECPFVEFELAVSPPLVL
jgi:hypothetical protein